MYINQKRKINSAKQVKLLSTLISRISFDSHLTGCEINCLLLAVKGKTSSETASLLGIKSCTVESHRQKIMRKLSSHTIAQAVYEGILFGYLSPKIRHSLVKNTKTLKKYTKYPHFWGVYF